MPQPRFRRSVGFALTLAASASAAQSAQGQTTVVEIVGLQSWTRQMVEDSVAKYSPGISLADAACAVVLRDSVGFANAAVNSFSFGGDTTWMVLSVVEPELRDRVSFRAYSTRAPAIGEWADLFEILEQDRGALNALQHPEVLLGGADTLFGRAVPEGTLELRRRLHTHGTARDWELARNAILTDSSYTNRIVAALVMSNFAERDSAFHLLAEGLRSTDRGASAAEMILSVLGRGAPRPINWRPARETLEALVGGTNLFAYGDLLDVLVATQIDPALGHGLARVNPALLLDHLGARNPSTPRIAHRFLVHVHRRDVGRDRAAWERLLAPE